MGLVFTPRANLLARGSLAALVLITVAVAVGGYYYTFSPWRTGVGLFWNQHVPFSHEHHVSGLGIDCRFCHASAETSAFAGMPTTEICMHCHWQIWTQAAMLEPERASWRTNEPLHWQRVNRVPDFVFFNHAIHVNKGIGCATCHGRVDTMPLMTKANNLYMKWCLACHFDPAPNLRPRSEIYNMQWQPPADQPLQSAELLVKYNIDTTGITNCTACHR